MITINDVQYEICDDKAGVTGYEGEPVDVVIKKEIECDGKGYEVEVVDN